MWAEVDGASTVGFAESVGLQIGGGRASFLAMEMMLYEVTVARYKHDSRVACCNHFLALCGVDAALDTSEFMMCGGQCFL